MPHCIATLMIIYVRLIPNKTPHIYQNPRESPLLYSSLNIRSTYNLYSIDFGDNQWHLFDGYRYANVKLRSFGVWSQNYRRLWLSTWGFRRWDKRWIKIYQKPAQPHLVATVWTINNGEWSSGVSQFGYVIHSGVTSLTAAVNNYTGSVREREGRGRGRGRYLFCWFLCLLFVFYCFWLLFSCSIPFFAYFRAKAKKVY